MRHQPSEMHFWTIKMYFWGVQNVFLLIFFANKNLSFWSFFKCRKISTTSDSFRLNSFLQDWCSRDIFFKHRIFKTSSGVTHFLSTKPFFLQSLAKHPFEKSYPSPIPSSRSQLPKISVFSIIGHFGSGFNGVLKGAIFHFFDQRERFSGSLNNPPPLTFLQHNRNAPFLNRTPRIFHIPPQSRDNRPKAPEKSPKTAPHTQASISRSPGHSTKFCSGLAIPPPSPTLSPNFSLPCPALSK